MVPNVSQLAGLRIVLESSFFFFLHSFRKIIRHMCKVRILIFLLFSIIFSGDPYPDSCQEMDPDLLLLLFTSYRRAEGAI